jgi:hypothetical protein
MTLRPGTNPFSSGDDFPSTATGVTLPGGVSAVFCDYPYSASVEFDNVIVKSWSGKKKATSKGAQRLRWNLAFEQLTPADQNALWNHFLAQSGNLATFSFFDYLTDEEFTVRYDMTEMSRETFLFQAEKTGIKLVEEL